MTSRERVRTSLAHRQPDRVPVDFGSTSITGISASFLYKLRRELGLADRPIRITCPYQMLGEVDDELAEWMGVDVRAPFPQGNLFGFDNNPAKPFTMPDGTPVVVPELFNTRYEADGKLFMYAEGDRGYPPSAVMPAGGYFFDAIIRQPPIDEDALDPADNLEEVGVMTDEALRIAERDVTALYNDTDYALVGGAAGTYLGDIAFVPAPMLKNPKGIRAIDEWYMSPLIRPDYIKAVFDRQTEIALQNLKLYYEAVGDKIDVLVLCGADFGSQLSLMCSVDTFREFYLPYYKRMIDWIHANTGWKVFKHSCGAIEPLIESFIEAGFDILNPVQCSAAGMEPQGLKDRYGDRITFWGGGVDTQKTLQYGSPDEVSAEVAERIRIFGKGGGFVFNTIHNTQATVPVQNFIDMIEALRRAR